MKIRRRPTSPNCEVGSCCQRVALGPAVSVVSNGIAKSIQSQRSVYHVFDGLRHAAIFIGQVEVAIELFHITGQSFVVPIVAALKEKLVSRGGLSLKCYQSKPYLQRMQLVRHSAIFFSLTIIVFSPFLLVCQTRQFASSFVILAYENCEEKTCELSAALGRS